MITNRILRIDKLIVAIPDDFKGTGSNGEVTIDDALQFLLDYRKSEQSKRQNKSGNYEYLSADIPDDMNPDDPVSLSPEALLRYLWEFEAKVAVGVMCTAIRDKELGEDAPYRNIYNDEEMQDYLEALRHYKEMVDSGQLDLAAGASELAAEMLIEKGKASHDKLAETWDKSQCKDCEQLCDENCPDDRLIPEDSE